MIIIKGRGAKLKSTTHKGTVNLCSKGRIAEMYSITENAVCWCVSEYVTHCHRNFCGALSVLICLNNRVFLIIWSK